MKEIWKNINGYEGYYQVSNLGRIKSIERDVYKSNGKIHLHKKERIKKPKHTKDGYLSVTLSVNSHDKTFTVHSLVANAFITKPQSNESLEINHIDTNRKNNVVSNLEWVTHAQNVKHSAILGKYRNNSGEKNGRCVPVTVCCMDGSEIQKFKYLGQCAEWLIATGCTRSHNIQQVASHIKQRAKKGLSCYGYTYNLINTPR